MDINTTYETPENTDERVHEILEQLEDFKDKLVDTALTVVSWGLQHPQELVIILGGVRFAWGKIDKYVDLRRDIKLRNSTIYDRSLGMYWQTKKPLTTNQRLQIESRHKAGEPYGKILSDMKILKR